MQRAIDIELRHVSHVFNGREQAVAALKNITFTVRAGEFVSIVGPSGCGKSTLLRLVAGLITPTHGEIRLAGQPPDQVRRRKEIGWMAQQPALLPWRTVLENVRLPLLVNRQARRPPATPEALLSLVGLSDFAHAYPHALSGGMQQRAALARVLASGPSLWLMDEPFAALDELTRAALGRELLSIWREFRPTVLWVTHHLHEAVRLSDRMIILSDRPGRITGSINIDLPRPREDTAAEFQAYVRRARAILGEDHG